MGTMSFVIIYFVRAKSVLVYDEIFINFKYINYIYCYNEEQSKHDE